MSNQNYLKETHKYFIESDDKVWELWTKATDASIHMNTSIYDNAQDIEYFRNMLWDLREMLDMVKSLELKDEYK